MKFDNTPEKSVNYKKLIAAAGECFADKGFKASSIREIAKRAGISLGSVYTYVKSKEDLISVVVEEMQKAALNEQKKTFTGSYFSSILFIISSSVSNADYPVRNYLLLEIFSESTRNAALNRKIIHNESIVYHEIESILLQGIEGGEFRDDLSIKEATTMILSIINGLIIRNVVDVDFSHDRYLNTVRDILKNELTNS